MARSPSHNSRLHAMVGSSLTLTMPILQNEWNSIYPILGHTWSFLGLGEKAGILKTESKNQAGLATGLTVFKKEFSPAIKRFASCAKSAMCSLQTAAAATRPPSSSWARGPLKRCRSGDTKLHRFQHLQTSRSLTHRPLRN